ncbi:MAG: mechanosensitive ion channel family protein [Sandaracinaceae bacterium]
MFTRRLVSAALVFFAALAAAAPAHAQQLLIQPGSADCSTPRRALETWLNNLQGEEAHPAQATRCFDWGAVRLTDPQRQSDVASRLKRVLDARGLYVQMEDIPDVEDPEDVTHVRPFPDALSALYLVQKHGQWVISADTIRAVPELHEETFAFDVDHYLDRGPGFLRETVFGVAWWQLILLFLFLGFAALVRSVVSAGVRTYGTRLLTRLVKRLDGGLLRRAALPIGTVVATLLLMWVFPILEFGVEVNRFVNFGLRVAAAVSGVLIVYRLVDVFADIMAKRAEATDTRLDDQLVPLIRKSLKTVTVVLGIIFVLQNMQVDVASLIAGVSLGGLAFTLAARDTVANLFGSVSIFADQPFQVGDWVVMQGVEGVVEEVGMRSTRVRTFYRSVVSIPNSKVADGIIDNYGQRDMRRTSIKLGLQYDSTPEQIEAFCQGVRAVLAHNEAVKQDAYHVYFTGFADSALEVMLYFFFDVETWTEEIENRHNIYLEVLRLADSLGVQFAFPTRTLHLASRAKETDLAPSPPPSSEALRDAVLGFGPGGSLARPGGPDLVDHGFLPGYLGLLEANHTQGDDPDADLDDSREE